MASDNSQIIKLVRFPWITDYRVFRWSRHHLSWDSTCQGACASTATSTVPGPRLPDCPHHTAANSLPGDLPKFSGRGHPGTVATVFFSKIHQTGNADAGQARFCPLLQGPFPRSSPHALVACQGAHHTHLALHSLQGISGTGQLRNRRVLEKMSWKDLYIRQQDDC